jgi:uncharacterized protein (TIGR02246 family)
MPRDEGQLSPIMEGFSMRPMSTRTSRAATFAAMPLVALFGLACSDRPNTAEPIAGRAVEASAQRLSNSIPTDPILDIVQAVTAAWTAKDAAAYTAPYATDVQVINPLGAVSIGRDALRAQHAFLFGGPFAGSTQTIDIRDIQFLTGTIAMVHQDVSLTGYAFLPPGLPSSGGVVRTRVTWVVEKRGGDWEIVFQQMTPRL